MELKDISNQKSKSYNWNKLIKHISVVISIGFLVNLLIIYFTTENFKLSQLLLFDFKYVLVAFILGIAPVFIHAYSIYVWVKCFNKNISFKAATKISAATLVGSAITPTMVGGGPLKMGMLMRHKLTTGEAAAITTFGGIQDFIAMAVFVIASILFSNQIGLDVFTNFFHKSFPKAPSFLLILLVVSTILVVLFSILSKTNIGNKVAKKTKATFSELKDAFKLVAKEGKMYFLATTVLNIFKWVVIHFILIFLLLGLSLKIDYVDAFLSEWLVFTGMTATPLPGGSGGAETIFFLVYKSIIPLDLIGITILAWRFFTDYTKLILSALLVVVLQNSSKTKESTSDF